MSSGSTLRVRQWVKTDKKQEFSDDEDESQVPLAPLPPEEADQGEDEDEEEEKEGSAAVQSGVATPLPAETSMRGVPGLDTPISGSATPGLNEPSGAIALTNRLNATASKPHPLSTSFIPDEEEKKEEVDDQAMLDGGDGGLIDSMNLDIGAVGMDGLEENQDTFMDMLNSGDMMGDGNLMNSDILDPTDEPVPQ